MLEVNTNLGVMPIIDYLHIKANEYGFNSYEDLLNNGYHIDIYTKEYYQNIINSQTNNTKGDNKIWQYRKPQNF